jgi:hypothetical protein
VSLTLTIFPRGPRGGKYREISVDANSGLIRGFGEVVADRPFFVGAAVIEPEALAKVPAQGPAEFVPTILAPAIEAGKAGAFMADGHWYDVGSPALWLETHVELLRALETGALPAGWRKRIEAGSFRVGPMAWTSRDSASRARHACMNWAGPCYWSAYGDEAAKAPREFGPRAVLYGTASTPLPLSGGIGFSGKWKS